ncbi:MAG: hypothetical protein FWC64_08810 [Treponema sp.]|nr:hypothetical protein [Treponema sp.]
MKYFIPLVVVVLALQSCENTDFTVIERAEITGADSINIYVSGDISQLDIIRDVVIFVNDVRGFHIVRSSHNAFQDSVGGLRRFRCSLNSGLTVGDTVIVTGNGRNLLGSAVVTKE